MSPDEYKAFRSRLAREFPALRLWFDSLAKDAQQGVRERWQRCLMEVDAVDAKAALDELGKGNPWQYDHEKERAGAIIAELASAKKRLRTGYHDDEKVRKGRYQPTGAYSIMGRIIRAIETDERHDEECQQHRALRRRCRLGCEVPRMVADEMLASEDAGEF